MKRFWTAALLLLAATAAAGTIKVWSNGDTLTAADLNANFAHIHGTMVGGHGAKLVNADVNAAAAISHSKLENHSLIPKAVGSVNPCTVSPCTLYANYGGIVTGVTRTATGVYPVAWNARTDAVFTFTVNAIQVVASPRICQAALHLTTGITVYCFDAAGVAADSGFAFTFFDNDL